MIRYSRVLDKNPREIVLLKSRPCKWGRCFFCDYIHDNSHDDGSIIEFNRHVLGHVNGEFRSLEVINSASVFELPYVENSTPVKQDKEIISWFKEKYSYLEKCKNIEVLWNNTDFGVGGDRNECK